jgi:putative transposase
MDVQRNSYSSSLGVQVAAVNFAVKYRHGIFADRRVHKEAIASFEETARAHGARTGLTVVAVGVDVDHVHLVVQWGPGASLSEVVRLLKGRCARDLLKAFPELRREKFWGGHLWSPAYHFLSTGQASLEHHVQYAQEQGKPRRLDPGGLAPSQRTLESFRS